MSSSMEKNLLRNMVKERDAKIESLKKLHTRQDKKLKKARAALEEIRMVQRQQDQTSRTEISDLEQEKAAVERQMAALEKEMKQSGTLHMYADLVKGADPNHVDSSYVLRIQAQLCKAMHSMGMLENQMAHVRDHSNDVVKSLKDEINTITEEKCKVEVAVITKLVDLDNHKKEKEAELKAILEEKEADLREVQDQLKSEQSNEEDDEESEGEESEEDDKFDDYDDSEEEEIDMSAEIVSLTKKIDQLTRQKDESVEVLTSALDTRTENIRRLREDNADQLKRMGKIKSELQRLSGPGNMTDEGISNP